MATGGIHPNDFDLNPNKIPTGGVVQIAEVDKKGVVRIKVGRVEEDEPMEEEGVEHEHVENDA